MTRTLPFALLAAAALLSAPALSAQTAKPAPKPTKTVTKTVTPVAHATAATHATVTKTSTKTTAPAAKGRMVTAKLANGKTVTYNCSLPGNAAKKVCK